MVRRRWRCLLSRVTLKAALCPGRGGLGTTWYGFGLVFRRRAPDDEQLADVLNRRGVELLADRREVLFAHFAFVVINPNLDEFVAIQASCDLFQYRLGESVLTDRDNRIQCMGARTQGTTLFGSNIKHLGNQFKERILPSFRP